MKLHKKMLNEDDVMLFRFLPLILTFSIVISHINAYEGWDLSQERILKNLKELESLKWNLSGDGLQYWFLGAKLGYYDVMTFLMPYVDINTKNIDGLSALQIAAKHGRFKIAKLLLENGVPVDQQNKWSIITPLALAAGQGHSDFVALILAHGGNIYNNRAAMHLAARNGHSKMLSELLEAGFDVDTKAETTPLHEAVLNGHVNIVKILIDNGADLEFEYERYTPLEAAAKQGHSEIVDILLEVGATMNNVHRAAFKGDMHCLKILISLGLESLKFSKNDMNALHFAACAGQNEVVKFLITNDFPIDGDYSNTIAPLHLAARNGHIEIVQMLLQAGADPNAFYSLHNIGKLTPAFLAAGMGHTEIINLLLTFGALINKGTAYKFLSETDRDFSCWVTPLHNAIHYGYLDTVIKLIHAGANIKAIDKGWSPLHEGAERGHEDIVQFLLEKGAEVNSKEMDRLRTPLHLAAKNGHLLTAKKLVSFGADISQKDKSGKTAGRLAAENGHFNVVDYFNGL